MYWQNSLTRFEMTSYAVDGIVTTPLFGSKNPPHWRKTTFLVNIHLPANLLDLAPDSSLVVNLSYDTKESAGHPVQKMTKKKIPFCEQSSAFPGLF